MSFAAKLIDWQRRHGRRGLPWQGTRDPYRVWLAEVMLQQTQVATVIPYYERFLRRFPTVRDLAAASEEAVLELWSGLGYYARGRNLHAAAKRIAGQGFPPSAARIAELPGVGRSTAAAIAAFCFGERAAILDGNAKRVLSRRFAIDDEDALWKKAEALLPREDIETYTQALMDLGATVCTRRKPACGDCPVAKGCLARSQGSIERFPAPRAKRVMPSRETTWHVLRHGARVLLERRPGSGIWGGLWCFPERDPGYPVARRRQLEPIEHGFTHFRLTIRPLLCELRRVAPRAEEPGRLWLHIDKARGAAVPAPVRWLLGRLPALR